MANVKLISFQMTDLAAVLAIVFAELRGRAAHVGTAGEMLEGPGGPLGSFSRYDFSSLTFLLVVIVKVDMLCEAGCEPQAGVDRIQQRNGWPKRQETRKRVGEVNPGSTFW